jgi:hypothetical protein
MDLFFIILCIGATWFFVYNFLYSPRAQINRILKQMFNIPIKLRKSKQKLGDEDNYFYKECKKALTARYKIIISLLDYYFDPKEDKEYIEEKTNYAKTLLDNVENIMLK